MSKTDGIYETAGINEAGTAVIDGTEASQAETGEAKASETKASEAKASETKASEAEHTNRRLYRYDRHAIYTDSLRQIGDEDIRRYRELGYLAVNHGLTEEEVQSATEAIMDIVLLRSRLTREHFKSYYLQQSVYLQQLSGATRQPEQQNTGTNNMSGTAQRKARTPQVQLVKPEEQLASPEERELSVRKIANFVEVEPRLHAIAHHPDILGVVERILGETPVLVQDMALLKPPFGGGEKPWHQDMAYRGLDYDKAVVGVWIALDEAAADNGCMHIIPRSHMNGGIPHYSVRDWQICDEKVDVPSDVVVPLPPGGLLLFHGLLHHGTPNNLSDKRRRALQFHYAPASAVQVTSQEYKRMFTNDISGATC